MIAQKLSNRSARRNGSPDAQGELLEFSRTVGDWQIPSEVLDALHHVTFRLFRIIVLIAPSPDAPEQVMSRASLPQSKLQQLQHTAGIRVTKPIGDRTLIALRQWPKRNSRLQSVRKVANSA